MTTRKRKRTEEEREAGAESARKVGTAIEKEGGISI